MSGTVRRAVQVRTGELVFEGVTKTFARGLDRQKGAKVFAADDLHFAVARGETVGIVGPNGAGKTTLLRLAAGITSPDSGRVVRCGRFTAVIELGVGLHPDLTGRENVQFVGVLLGLSSRELAQRSDEMLEFSGLRHHLDRPVKHYSTGMLARLSFSIAAFCDPDLLVVDEVLSVGDLEFQHQCRLRLQALTQAGTTMFIVSHDLGLIAQLCTRAIHLEAGRIVADGPSIDVISDYLGGALTGTSGYGHLELRKPSFSNTNDAARFELVADIELNRRWPDLKARVQVVIPEHPTAHFDDSHAGPLVFVEEPLEFDWSGPGQLALQIELDISAIPPGAYRVLVILEATGWAQTLTASTGMRVNGPLQKVPTAVVRAEWSVDGALPARPTDVER